MRLVRGSLSDTERDREVTRRFVESVEGTGQPALRAWTPPKQVAFGRRDTTRAGYERARDAARERGYEPVERSVGGHAVVHTGETVAFVYTVARDDDRDGIRSRYQDVSGVLKQALGAIGVPAVSGEPDASFCPGAHSLQRDGKIVGIAQRVRRNIALVGGYVVVTAEDEHEVGEVLAPVYDGLDVPFDAGSVGSVEGAGGPGSPGDVVDAIESAFVGERDGEVGSASAVLE